MDERIREWVRLTREQIGLESYELYSCDIKRELDILDQTRYLLSMEWFPKGAKRTEKGLNPKGTAVVELDIHTQKFKTIIFTEETTYARRISLDVRDPSQTARWIEEQTGLTYGKQFQLSKKQKDGKITYRSCIRGIPVSPSGWIEVKTDPEGSLVFFSVTGPFPEPEEAEEEDFSLATDQISEQIRQQFTLSRLPSQKEEKWIPYYAMEEIYVRNDRSSFLPFFASDSGTQRILDDVMEWEAPVEGTVQRREIELSPPEITVEQALRREPHPDAKPIPEEQIPKIRNAVRTFLSKAYPDDSGKWKLLQLKRENGYILAVLRPVQKKDEIPKLLGRKLVVFLDPETLDIVNYLDNDMLMEAFSHFAEAGPVRIPKEEAIAKIRDKIELSPVYVYDAKRKKYVLCGKLDCRYAVRADNGEVTELNEI